MMTEAKAAKWLNSHFTTKRGAIFTIRNVYFFQHNIESDFLAVTYDREVIEVEIKVSKWDYLNDFKKAEKHELLQSKRDLSKIPNMLYYCTTKGLVSVDEVPDYAGLYEIESSGKIKVVKKAPRLHNEKMNPKKWESLAIKLFNKITP